MIIDLSVFDQYYLPEHKMSAIGSGEEGKSENWPCSSASDARSSQTSRYWVCANNINEKGTFNDAPVER